MKIGIASGYWSQNIGNAFFQLGGAHMLRRALGDVEIITVPDALGNWTLRNKATGNPKMSFDVTGRVAGLDYLVIQGPSLSWHVDEFWRETLRSLRKRGTRVLLTGVAFYRFDDDEVAAARRFLSDADPVCISTRDSRSYELLCSMGLDNSIIFDGIDSGFWTPFETVPDIDAEPYLCVTFDRYVEPRWRIADPTRDAFVTLPNGEHITWNVNDRLNSIASRGKAVAYVSAAIDRFHKGEPQLAGYSVVRPEHRSNPPMHWKVFNSPNGYMSDEPWSYLALYRSAAATLSDRVHACVAALAFGRPAMLFNSSPRGSLLERVAGPEIRSDLVQLPPGKLDGLRSQQEEFLRGVIVGSETPKV
ncbi:polysaccharide pyruvyl transferase family protein [Nocardioides mangrovi]|uniref:Polysaccharide pyruvyl transferase family protein n=1 Tax=Nocardioides mangrovi TaxID=2874580 RepID=A0ABS7UBX4_9ACTN|nr:polysaccharide pyruvyl transferase family protein [Nocardioides mangrovi]MBZ5738503.1 polysaccharide pyruvyl transferase family protein [Nocardioides mangrovi]